MHLHRDSRESCEAGLRGRLDVGVGCVLAVPWQADFSDCTNRAALARDHVENRVGVEISQFKSLRMKSDRWINDAGKSVREIDYFAIRRRPYARHDHRRDAGVQRTLDWARRVGILVSVEMNVTLYQMFLHITSQSYNSRRIVRMAFGVTR